MKLVVFGLTMSSSWGNGHATIWRGLARGLSLRGHKVIFFEKDVPYYSSHRDLTEAEGAELVLYESWNEIRARAQRELSDADAGIITSYCPDAACASDMLLASKTAVRCFYDLDTPVTLKALQAGEIAEYIPRYGLGDFDVVLSYTGGKALDGLKTVLNARRVEALYGSVDPLSHGPAEACREYAADLSYLGTYAADRQGALTSLLIRPAEKLTGKRFIIGGALYPEDFPWKPNIYFVRHVPPPSHPSFYCSSDFTLNVTRGAMKEMGFCPSGRLFEAAACGVPVISDCWEGLDTFFEPDSEIVLAHTGEDVIAALSMDKREIRKIGRRARQRALDEHTSFIRARELEGILEKTASAKKEEPCGG